MTHHTKTAKQETNEHFNSHSRASPSCIPEIPFNRNQQENKMPEITPAQRRHHFASCAQHKNESWHAANDRAALASQISTQTKVSE